MWARENHATSGHHVRFATGTVVANRYEILGEAGCGNFARVFEGRDVNSGQRVALKFMKPGYERDADFEVDVLTAVNQKDPGDTCGIVRYIERLRHQGHTALVFTLKGKSLRSSRMPMSRDDIRRVVKDVASALSFLHISCKAVHTDLKPENILSDTNAGRSWCICDFGSASFYTASLDTDLITTRPYRAPEVVLKRGWTYSADTWSLGCILYELFTGRKMFDAHSDGEHLEMMQARLGPIPSTMHPPRTSAISSKSNLLRDELKAEPELLSLLEAMLQYEPSRRIACGDVVKHPFFSGQKEKERPLSAALGTMTLSAINARAGLPSKREDYGGANGGPLKTIRPEATFASLPLRPPSFTRTSTAPTIPYPHEARQYLTSPALRMASKHTL